MSQGFGMKERRVCQPTYVYPIEVKMLLRSVFSENICDFPDPCHNNVSVKYIKIYYSRPAPTKISKETNWS